MSATPDKFACEKCGKRYVWKPELVRKKARCSCGQEMVVPAQPLGAAPAVAATKAHAPAKAPAKTGSSGDDLYDLAPTNDPPKPKAPAQGAPVAALAAPASAAPVSASGRVLAYRGAPAPVERMEESVYVAGPLWREIYLPIGLIVLGLMFHLGREMYFSPNRVEGLLEALPRLGAHVIINLVLSFIAVLMVAKLFEISFGAVGPAILKLIAIALVPSALADAVGYLVGSDSFFVAMAVSSILYMPLCYFAFSLLFQIDLADASYCVLSLWLVNQWAVVFIVNMIFSGSDLVG